MDIQQRKIEFVQAFLKLQNEEVLSLLEKVLHSSSGEDLTPMSKSDLIARIKKSEIDFDKGAFKSHEDVFAKYQ